MFFGQLPQAGVINKQFTIPVGDVGLAGHILASHFVLVAGVGEEALGVAAVAALLLFGSKVSGKVARCVPDAVVGMNSAPLCPQPGRLTMQLTRTMAHVNGRTKIWRVHIILKL
jgi:hypothetical protein